MQVLSLSFCTCGSFLDPASCLVLSPLRSEPVVACMARSQQACGRDRQFGLTPHKHKDPTRHVVSGIPLCLGFLEPKSRILMVT